MTTTTGFEGIQTAKVNGTTLAYREQGEGEPVVFVHGAISDLRTWEQQLPTIGRSYRAITYSRRYARPNEAIDPAADDDQMLPHVEDLAALLREMGAAPVHLVGNSWGAFISLLTAMRHSSLVRTLVLEEPPVMSLFGLSARPRPAEVLRLLVKHPQVAVELLKVGVRVLPPLVSALRRGEDENAMRIFAQAAVGKESFERIPEARKEQMRENFAPHRAGLLGAGYPNVVDDDVRGVNVPVLLVTGKLSPRIAIHLTDRLEELLPSVERVEIPAASHLMHEENAAATNEAILEFIGRHGGGPASAPPA